MQHHQFLFNCLVAQIRRKSIVALNFSKMILKKLLISPLFFSSICLAFNWDNPATPFNTQENVHENIVRLQMV